MATGEFIINFFYSVHSYANDNIASTTCCTAAASFPVVLKTLKIRRLICSAVDSLGVTFLWAPLMNFWRFILFFSGSPFFLFMRFCFAFFELEYSWTANLGDENWFEVYRFFFLNCSRNHYQLSQFFRATLIALSCRTDVPAGCCIFPFWCLLLCQS